MNKKIFENSRICPKGDIEANWNKAVGFIPLDKEIIIYKADEEHPVARFKIGDGKTVVQDLLFSGTDIEAIQKLINEKGELLIEYVDNAVAAIIEQLDQKLDKSGGLIGGDLSIQGNLNVAGTTTAKDTETIMVKDNTIVANSEGIELLEEAGFVVKTNITDAYGIMYDPSGDGVKIGLGAIDESGKFNYTEGEDQFLATRANTIVDGHTVVWDDENKTLVDSGVDHSEYVKFTDIATGSKAGVVRAVGDIYGISINPTNGNITLSTATDTELAKQAVGKAVKVSQISKAVKIGITTNTETWTDDEKAKACETIGAVKKDTAQQTSGNIIAPLVYTNDTNIKHFLATHNKLYNVYNIPMLFGSTAGKDAVNGHLLTAIPINNYHAANKKYVDDGFVAKITDTISENKIVRVYSVDNNGNQILKRANSNQETDGLMMRDGAGRARVNEPYDDKDIANKKYVDDGFVAKDTVSSNGVYGKSVGNEYFYAISQGVTGDTVARRNNQGYLYATSNIKAGDNCLLNIKTATDNFVSKFTDTSGYNRLYGEDVGGNQMAISIQYPNYGFDANSANSRNGIPAYVNGNLGCSIPTSDYHTANKKYVDEGFVAKQEYSNTQGSFGTDGEYHARVYGVKYDGTEETIPVANQAKNYSICWRDANANIYVDDPTQSLHCVNKRYAEANFVPSITLAAGQHAKAYIVNANGQAQMDLVPGEAKQWTIPQRGADGVIYTGTPTENGHATTKKYVDELVGLAVDSITTVGLWNPVHKEYTTILDTDGRKWDCDAVGYYNIRTNKHKVEYTLISTQDIAANADTVAISVPLLGVNYTLGAKYRAATIAYSALPTIEENEEMSNEAFKQSYFTLDGFTWDERTDIGNECTPLPFRGSGGFEVKVLTWTDNPAASITFKTIIAKVTKYEV